MLPAETTVTRFNQLDREGKFVDNAKELIDKRLEKLRKKDRNPRAKWKVVVVAFTGHGFISYPAK